MMSLPVHENFVQIGITSSSPYSGSPTFDEIPFFIEPGCRPLLGTYVLVSLDQDNAAIYGRIVEGTEENPKADPVVLQKQRAYRMDGRDPRSGDLSPHVSRIMIVEVLGEVIFETDDNLRIDEPKTLALTGKPVYALPAALIPALLGIPKSSKDGLHLGIISSSGADVPFFLPRSALARHIAIVGKSGTGKSYATGVIVEELTSQKIPVIAFDVLDDLRSATEALKGRQYEGGRDFRVPYSVVGVGEFLNFTPNLTKDQSEIVALAYSLIQNRALQELEDAGTITVSYSDLEIEIREIGKAFGQEPVADRASKRVSAALKRSRILTETLDDWTGQLSKVPILNVFVGRLPQQQRNLIVGAAARVLQVLRRRELVPPCVFILDEAHFFLPAGENTPSTGIVREMIRTARHDAIGVVLITQSPSSIDKQVLLTCNTRIVFALDREDLRAVEGTMSDVPDAVIRRIPKLPKGNAMITSGADIMRHSARIEIRARSTPEGAPTPDLMTETIAWRKRLKQS